MTEVTGGSATTRMTQAGRVHIGWRYAQAHPHPGPPPRPPEPPEAERSGASGPAGPSGPAGRRREEKLLNRPLKIVAAGAGAGALCFVAVAVSGVLPWMFAGLALVACAFVLSVIGNAIWQGERFVRSHAEAERARLEQARESRERSRTAANEEHARARREWESRRRAYEAQREWHPVSVPSGVDRLDLAGGTLTGWSAAVTMMGAARLAAGSQVTVLDLSEGAVAGDLLRLATDRGDDPLVWVLPTDLPRLDLTSGLGPEELADVLSLVVGAGEDQGSTRDLSFDNAILERIIRVLGGDAARSDGRPDGRVTTGAVTIPQITAALRALAQVGDPRDDLRLGLLTDEQLGRITTMFGRGAADRVVIEHAWALESQLRKLEALGADPVWLPPSRLQVVSLDRRAGVLTNRVLGTYAAIALTHALRDTPDGHRWDHTLFLCCAEKLRGDVLDRLIDACETTGTGLVLMYRSIPAHVRERLGRGHAAVGFMRLGTAADAGFAVDHIGAEHRLLVAEVTDAAGKLVADLKGTPYASTVGPTRVRHANALTDPVWSPPPAPDQRDAALARGIGSTEWARSVSAPDALDAPDGPDAADADGTDRNARRRSRELRIEPHQLRELPPTAMVFTHATASGRHVVLVDANPGIMTLPTAHAMEYEEEECEKHEKHVRDRATPAERAAGARDEALAGQSGQPDQPGQVVDEGAAGAVAEEVAGEVPAAPCPTPRPAPSAVPGAASSAAPGPAAPRVPRARHAAPRGAGPRGPKVTPSLRSRGRHAVGGDRDPADDRPAPNHDPPTEHLDSLP